MNTISLDTPAGAHFGNLFSQVGDGGDNAAYLRALRRQLRRACQQELTDRQRQVLTLYYEEGLPMRQIAACLHVNCSTVCRTLQRARRRLQRCLRYCL